MIDSLFDLPNTKLYLERIGAEPRSLQKAVVRQEQGDGYWLDLAIVRFAKDGTVTTEIGYEPTEAEQAAICAEFVKLEWPETVDISLDDPDMPRMVKEADEKNLFVFKDKKGKIIMLQVRFDKRDGKKAYVPITKWSDGKFRFLEPEGKLPLFGLENLKDHTTVLIVEGAKTARHVQWMVDGKTPEARKARENHPWGEELQNLCVLGWCSGALSPARTDWTPIRKAGVTRAYVCLDNDESGRSALPVISKNLYCVTHSIEFTEDFPTSFDLYDEFPSSMFKTIGDKRYYVGPSFHDLTHPATWMTNVIPNPEDPKKNIVTVRHHAKSLWQFVGETQEFIYVERPEIIRSSEILDQTLRPFCDTKKISELLLGVFTGHMATFDYCPYTTKRRINKNGKAIINTYTPSWIKAKEGDITPFLEFMSYLIPDKKECELLKRWCATLIARPDIRMLYSVLLVSANTGTGKSTLLYVLENTVGPKNSVFPTEKNILSEFNSWVSNVRFVGVHEIYAGSSFKMFNRLKDLITEPVISVRRLYRDSVTMSNWAHFAMCSNSIEALKIDPKDRRIFAPTVTEDRWSDEKFTEFRNWLDSGGFSIILWWAKNYGDYVKPSEKAPMTGRKLDMIENSRSDASRRIEDLVRIMNEQKKPVAIGDAQIKEWLQAICKEPVYEKGLTIRQEAKSYGALQVTDAHIGNNGRLSFSSQTQNFICNQILVDMIEKISDIEGRRSALRSHIVRPSGLMVYEEN